MAFFDDLGKKISQAGQSAVQKTKDITDIARINSAISDEEKKINNNYLEIGKLYVAKHSADYESDFADLITAVKESEIKIGEYRRQVQDIKGIDRCEKCGADVVAGMAFCSACGNPMPKPEAKADESLIKCTNCGAMISKATRFCTSCGKAMAEIVAETAPNEPAPASEPASQFKFCANCGAKMDINTAFCTNCGNKLN